MDGRYIAFDVETPNWANNRMSSIGITVVEGGRVVWSYDTLINPETHFDPFNVSLTGITPEQVADQPAFPALWQEIGPLLGSGLLVAHNAPFDLSVLAKCLRDYHISWQPAIPYVCTCQMSRRLLPQLPNHKLNTLCGYLGLELDHHQAGSDSRACSEILLHCLNICNSIVPFVRTYDLSQCRTVRNDPGIIPQGACPLRPWSATHKK